MAEEKSDPEIKVTDRRRFSSQGEAVGDSEASEAAPGPAAEVPPKGRPPLPPATFEFLVLSLRWQAEMQLGLYGGTPEDEEAPSRDLEGARHAIDMLSVLQERTRGNLSLEEQRLLENSLTELRFRYVQAAGAAAKK